MAWLDDFLQLQPQSEIANRLEQERVFVFALWSNAYRAGATAGFSVLGSPDPRLLAEDTLRSLRAYALEQKRPQQVSVLDNRRGAEGWRLAYYAGWNAALDALEAATPEGQQPRLLDTATADMQAAQLLQKNQVTMLHRLEERVGRSRIPDMAQAATRFVRRVSRAVQSSRFWPAAQELPPAEDYNLDPPEVDDVDDREGPGGNVVQISSRHRGSSHGASRRVTPKRASDWEPPAEAYPSQHDDLVQRSINARAAALSPPVRKTKATRAAVAVPSTRAPTKKRKKPVTIKVVPAPTKAKRKPGRPKGSGKPVAVSQKPTRRTRHVSS